MATDRTAAPASDRARLWEVARVFLRLGTTAFGGPAAHIALLEDEVVRRRAWLSRADFLDYLGATNLIPGPNSTEMAIHLGHVRAGWRGLIVAGVAFIVPAATIVCLLAWAYVHYGALPQLTALLYGIKPVVIAVVAQALYGLGRTALKNATVLCVGIASVVAVVMGVHELIVLAGAALVMIVIQRLRSASPMPDLRAMWLGAGSASSAAGGLAAPTTFGLTPLFLVFLKIGSVLFGSGYVLLAFLRADLVERLGWLTERQLLDATAVGLVTPGPVFTAATFVGYLLGGMPGALVATAGIFLPAFVFVALSGPIVRRIRQSATAGAALDGVNAASLALMAVVSVLLARTALIDPTTWLLALASLIALVRFRVSSAWLVVVGGVVGLMAR